MSTKQDIILCPICHELLGHDECCCYLQESENEREPKDWDDEIKGNYYEP